MRCKERGRAVVAHNAGGNIFIWTVLWLVFVAGVAPVFVNVSALVVVQQQFAEDAQDAMAAAVQTYPHNSTLARRKLMTLLTRDMPKATVAIEALSERDGIGTATISVTMLLPVPIAGWSQWSARRTIEAS